MAAGTLYTYPENFRAYKALIAAQYASANVKLAPNFVFGETNKTEAFLKKFPSGKVPAFETADGKYLNDSNAIAYYVANQKLRGGSDLEKAEVIQWISFADNEVLPAACAWVFPVLGIMQFNKNNFERAKEDIKTVLAVLNQHLTTRTYLVGERITLADIIVACTLLHVYAKVLDPACRKPYNHVNRWFLTMVNQPEFKAINGEPQICDKVAEVDPKKFQQQHQQPAAAHNNTENNHNHSNNNKNQTENQGKSSKKKKSKGKDNKKEQKKEEKKDEKKEKKQPSKKEKEPEEELDAADAALLAEPKQKDPFDLLPKGTFVMDDFKRCYSNEEETVSVPYFWEKFDPENYSIWFGEYKYNNELSKVFMSCNLITGMFQRLDKMRKQAFASVCLFGDDNNSTISGVWVWRGHELAFPLSPDWQIDYEVYEWKKLDAKSEETKKLVQQYFSWTGTDKDGRKFNQGKIFK